ncbi:transcription elongation factor GreA [Desulfocurvus sp. DL9XJH121]
MNSIPISAQGYARVREELDKLKKERPAVIEAIALAREEGDLRENAGYDAARERQGMLEAKINFIESRLPLYDVIDLATLGGERVIYGATVELEDLDTEQARTYTLVGPDEVDWVQNGISILSPVARALLGKEEGDEVAVETPRGRIEYEVVSVKFLGEAMLHQ